MQLQHKNEIINTHHSTPTLHSIEQSTPVPLPSGEYLLYKMYLIFNSKVIIVYYYTIL